MTLDMILLTMLLLYLAIGAVFALSVLQGMNARLHPAYHRPRWAFWTTHVLLFLRWTCAWLPIVVYNCTRR